MRKHGHIILYCKGADTVIRERLDSSETDLMAITDDHLHVGRMGLIDKSRLCPSLLECGEGRIAHAVFGLEGIEGDRLSAVGNEIERSNVSFVMCQCLQVSSTIYVLFVEERV